MHESSQRPCVRGHIERHLEQAATSFQLDEQLGVHHGLSWTDFVLLTLLDGADGAMSSLELAGRLSLSRSRLVLQLLPLEKTGLVARGEAVARNRKITLRASGRRLLYEARDTAEAVCAGTHRLRNVAP